MSQRNIAEHYSHLAAEREALLEALLEFAEEHLERFPEPDVAADVYVAASGRVLRSGPRLQTLMPALHASVTSHEICDKQVVMLRRAVVHVRLLLMNACQDCCGVIRIDVLVLCLFLYCFDPCACAQFHPIK